MRVQEEVRVQEEIERGGGESTGGDRERRR